MKSFIVVYVVHRVDGVVFLGVVAQTTEELVVHSHEQGSWKVSRWARRDQDDVIPELWKEDLVVLNEHCTEVYLRELKIEEWIDYQV